MLLDLLPLEQKAAAPAGPPPSPYLNFVVTRDEITGQPLSLLLKNMQTLRRRAGNQDPRLKR